MKKSIKLSILILSLILVLSLIAACSSSKSNDEGVAEAPSYNTAYPDEGYGGGKGMDGGDMARDEAEIDPASPPSSLEPEKVITTYELDFETTEFDKTINNLTKLIEKYKGYIENSDISYNQYYNNKSYRRGSFAIRIPKNDALSFKTELNGIGNMISESTRKEDVTKQYRDTESRLKVLTTQEERILALLEEADNIQDIIALEERLSYIIYEKEHLQASLMNLDDKVEFSTIYIDIQEVERLRSTEDIDTSFGTKIKNAIENSIYGFVTGLENMVIWMILAAPFLILLALILFLAYRIIKRRRIKRDIQEK